MLFLYSSMRKTNDLAVADSELVKWAWAVEKKTCEEKESGAVNTTTNVLWTKGLE